MALVAAKCTNCGAALQVDNTKDAAICQHCGSAFIVEKAINHYHISNTITADTVNVYTAAADFVIRAGVLEKYNGAETDVVIPAGVNIIGAKAFEGCIGLTSVVIPEGVTEIGERAFEKCISLSKVHLPSTLKKIEMAFVDCGELHELVIPAGVEQATVQCPGLKKLVFSEGTKRICQYAARNCINLEEVELPTTLEIIGYEAFSYCEALKSMTIPANVATVENKAFYRCTALSRLTVLGASTRFLYDDFRGIYGSFYGCRNLTEIIFPDPAELNRQDGAFGGAEWFWRRQRGVCTHCGSSFKGLLHKVCKGCGRPKDY